MPESQQLSDVGLSATSDTPLQLLARFTNVGQTSEHISLIKFMPTQIFAWNLGSVLSLLLYDAITSSFLCFIWFCLSQIHQYIFLPYEFLEILCLWIYVSENLCLCISYSSFHKCLLFMDVINIIIYINIRTLSVFQGCSPSL